MAKLKDVLKKEDREKMKKIQKNVSGNSKVNVINKSLNNATPNFHQFCPISKVDEEKRMVWGIATKEGVDSQDEIVEYEATKRALPEFSKFRNLREMHKESAVGTIPEIECDDVNKQVNIGAKVVDESAWQKVKEGVYKGFSIGGRAINRVKEFNADMGKTVSTVKDYLLSEISLVDRPAHPECCFTMFKRETADPLEDDIMGMKKIVKASHKKILSDSAIAKLSNSQFGLIRKFRKGKDTTVERIFPMPTKMHARAVQKNLMKYDGLTLKERAIVHEKIRKVLGSSFKKEVDPFYMKYHTFLISKGGDKMKNGRIEQAIAILRGAKNGAEDEEYEGNIDISSQEPVDQEDIRPAPQKKKFSPGAKAFEGSRYEDSEGYDDYDDEEYEEYDGGRADEYDAEADTGLDADDSDLDEREARTHLYNTKAEVEDEKRSPDSEDYEGYEEYEDDDAGGGCPYCGTTLKAMTAGTIKKSAAPCPACGKVWAIDKRDLVSIQSDSPRRISKRGRRIRKSGGNAIAGLVDIMQEMNKNQARLEKRLNKALSKRAPRRKEAHRITKNGGTEEDLQKADQEDKQFQDDMAKAKDINTRRNAGEQVAPSELKFAEDMLTKSIKMKVEG